MPTRQRVVMVASSYPRFPGDTVGTFMEPIAKGIAARGHEVHLVLPWHPLLARRGTEDGVHFHAFRYAPLPSMHVFGYAGSLEADVRLRWTALAVAPIAVASAWLTARRVALRIDATILHGHWVVPGGAVAAWAAGKRALVVSLHGSDVYLAERQAVSRRVARRVLGRAGAVIACSDDLRTRALALGAASDRTVTIPYGVDATRFRPDADARVRQRAAWGFDDGEFVAFALGRFVRKKGFEYLIDAVARLSRTVPDLRLVIAGTGDLDAEFRAQVERRGLERRVLFTGRLPHAAVPAALAGADVVVVPSVRDDAGNVDGLPNVVLEALASATPVIATSAGGIASVVEHGWSGLLVPERDPDALAEAIESLRTDPERRVRFGTVARARMIAGGGWGDVARRIEAAYDEALAHAAHARPQVLET